MTQNLKLVHGTCQDQQGQTGLWNEKPIEDYGDEGNWLRAAPLKWNETKGIEVGGKEEVWAQGARALPFPRNSSNQSPTDLPARKKHDAVPSCLLNADPLAQKQSQILLSMMQKPVPSLTPEPLIS